MLNKNVQEDSDSIKSKISSYMCKYLNPTALIEERVASPYSICDSISYSYQNTSILAHMVPIHIKFELSLRQLETNQNCRQN